MKNEVKTHNYKFFNHKQCEYFPCHKTDNLEDFNCLFCYCPLYALGDQCGGNFTYTKKGIKNCSDCTIPHIKGNYDRIIDKMGGIMDIARKKG